MEQQGPRDHSPSLGILALDGIKQEPSPDPTAYPQLSPDDASIGLGLGLSQPQLQEQPQQQPQQEQEQEQQQQPQQLPPDYNYGSGSGFLNPEQQPPFDPNQQPPPDYATQNQQGYLPTPSFNETGDFSLFPPPNTQGEQYDQPLFQDNTLNAAMSSPQIHHTPTPPHLLNPEPQGSPAFNQTTFSSPPIGHSRHTSLVPEAAWTQPQFQTHRRSPSEFSDVSSVAPSPNLMSHDTFESIEGSHSPMQRAVDPGMFSEVLSMGNFSLSDPQHSPNLSGRSPSHSPAISPRILPSQLPDINQPPSGFAHPQQQPPSFGTPGFSNMQPVGEAFPPLHPSTPEMGTMAPPAINIDYAPAAGRPGFEAAPKGSIDADSLTPPDNRGMWLVGCTGGLGAKYTVSRC